MKFYFLSRIFHRFQKNLITLKVGILLQKVEFLLKSRIHRYAKGTLALLSRDLND
jgi:hypothetical protein